MISKYNDQKKAEADAKLRWFTKQLLTQLGFAHFSIELLATTSGVAKTTIYRRVPEANATKIAKWALGVDLEEWDEDIDAVLETIKKNHGELAIGPFLADAVDRYTTRQDEEEDN